MEGKKRKTSSPISAGCDIGSCKKKPRQGEEKELNEERNEFLQINQGHQTGYKTCLEEGVQDELPSKSVPSKSSSYSLSSFLNSSEHGSAFHFVIPQQRKMHLSSSQSVCYKDSLQHQQSLQSSGSSKTEGEVGERRGQVSRTTTVHLAPIIEYYCKDVQRRSAERVTDHGSSSFPDSASCSIQTAYYPSSPLYYSHRLEQTHADYPKTCTEYQKTREDYQKSRDDCQKTHDDYQKTCDDYRKTCDDYRKIRADFKKTHADFPKKLPDLRKKLAEYRKKLADYRKKLADYRKKLADYRKKIAVYQKNLGYQKTHADYQKTRADLQREFRETLHLGEWMKHGSSRIHLNRPSISNASTYDLVATVYDKDNSKKMSDTLEAEKEELKEYKNEPLHKYQQSRTSSPDPSLEQTPADFQKTHADYQKIHADYQKTRADFQNTHADFPKKLPDHGKKLADFQKTHADYQKTHADYQKTLADFQNTHADYRKTRADYQKTRADYGKTHADFPKKLPGLRKKLADYRKKLADYRKKLADYRIKLADYRKNFADYQKLLLDQQEQKLDTLLTGIDLMGPKFTNSIVGGPTCFQSRTSTVAAPPCPQNTPTVLQDSTVCTEGSGVQDAFELSPLQSESEPRFTAVNYSVTNTLPTHSHLLQTPECFRSRRDSSCLPRSHSLSSLSQITSAKNKSLTRAESLPDMLLTNSFEEFTPEMTADENDETYSFQCSCPGLYQCSVTGLVFHMEGEGDVVYRIVPWNRRLLAQHHKKPAGPLFDISCPQQSVCQLHLPHCEIRSTGGCDFLSVAHVNDEGIECIIPHKITETHVIINITRFSAFGNVKDEDSPPDLVRALVLLFFRPPADPEPKSLLNVLLLPKNVVLRDVLRTRKKLVGDENYIEISPHCKLCSNHEYTLSTCPEDDSVLVQPKKAEFDSDNYDNYFPSFQVRFKKVFIDITLLLRDTNSSHSVWEREVCLSSPGVRRSCGPSILNLPSTERLFAIRSSFIDGISGPVLKSLLDKLLEKKVIADSERESADVIPNKRDKARFVIDTVRNKGEAASLEMIDFLCEADPFLCEHLELT